MEGEENGAVRGDGINGQEYDVVGEEEQQQQQQEGGLQAQTAGLSALFPSPPSQAALFTRDNVYRLFTLQQARDDVDKEDFDWENSEPQERIRRQTEILTKAAEAVASSAVELEKNGDDVEMESSDQERKPLPKLLPAPAWDILLEMEPPRVDWIEEDGFYSCFGETWPVEERLAGLKELEMRQFYPDDCSDKRIAMVTLLRTLLKSYLGLIDVILETPQEYPANGQEWRFVSQDKAKDINDLSINFMHLLNEMRPFQAKEDLRNLLTTQLSRRKEEANLIKLQCKAMREQLAKMRQI